VSGALPAPRVSLRLYPRACDAAFAFRPPPLPRALYKLLRRAPSRRFGREREAAARASQPSEEPRQQQKKKNSAHSPPKSFASSASACLSRPPSADATPRAACASYVPYLQGIESSVGSPFCGWCGSNGAACASGAMDRPRSGREHGAVQRTQEHRVGTRAVRGQRMQPNAAECSGVRGCVCVTSRALAGRHAYGSRDIAEM